MKLIEMRRAHKRFRHVKYCNSSCPKSKVELFKKERAHECEINTLNDQALLHLIARVPSPQFLVNLHSDAVKGCDTSM